MPLQATSGAASYDAFGGGVPAVPNYIEEVFQTQLWTGTGLGQTVNNGIDLSGKGGMVWMKARVASGFGTPYDSNIIEDTNRGAGPYLQTNATNAEDGIGSTAWLASFNSNGYSFGDNMDVTSKTYVGWTFRKQPKFFDVVTYTGTGSNTTIAHNLGSVPACIMVKRTDAIGAWQIYHRSLANTEYLVLNTTAAKATGASRWNSTTPTSTVFSLGTDATVNASGGTYVAYLWAHDAGGFGLTGTDNVISCGSFNTGATNQATITLGWEPQWVLIKDASAASDWWVVDNMRGMAVTGNQAFLRPNTSGAETSTSYLFRPTATGFTLSGSGVYNNNEDYIYIAIRRGPMKVPTTGTSVFSPIARSGTGATSTVSNNITTDLIISMTRNTGQSSGVWDRLRGFPSYLETTGTASESTSSDSVTAMNNTAYVLGADSATDRINRSGYTYANWTFSRAPSFFDVVCYTGTNATQTLTHNLGVVPEMMIIKARNNTSGWRTYVAPLGNTSIVQINTNSAATTGRSDFWDSTTPTSTAFTVGSTISGSGLTYVNYLFATLAGVSKVGSYTGTGAAQTINCGFTSGSRFVMIKRTDSTGDWYVWDSARGIIPSNDPYLLLNSTAAEVTGTDYVDTTAVGFDITSTAPAAINASGGTYIFLAIA